MKSLITVRYILPLLLIKVRAGFDRDIIKDSDIFNQYVLPGYVYIGGKIDVPDTPCQQ